MNVAKKIRESRERLKYSQHQLAKSINVDKNTIWRWENEKTIPTINDIKKLADALNTSISYLMGEDEDTKTTLPATLNTAISRDNSVSVVSQGTSTVNALGENSNEQTFVFEMEKNGMKFRLIFPWNTPSEVIERGIATAKRLANSSETQMT